MTWVIITAILAGVGVPVPWLFGIILSVAFVVVLNRARSKKLEALSGG